MIPEITLEQAGAIVDLAQILRPKLSSTTIAVAVLTDGEPIRQGMAYVYSKENLEYDTVIGWKAFSFRSSFIGASSSQEYSFVDPDRLAELKAKSGQRIYVDWRTKTGKLGELLKRRDENCLYAVLSDPHSKADLRATAENIPKLDWPHSPEALADVIGIKVHPTARAQIEERRGALYYQEITTTTSREFYAKLFSAIDKVMRRRDDKEN